MRQFPHVQSTRDSFQSAIDVFCELYLSPQDVDGVLRTQNDWEVGDQGSELDTLFGHHTHFHHKTQGEGEEHVEGEKKKRKRRKKKQTEEKEKEPEEEVEVSEGKRSVEEVEGERRESEEEKRKSEDKEEEETEEAVEEKEEEKPTEELGEEGGKEEEGKEGHAAKVSLSSEELRMIEERAEIEKQYETLVKLRIEKMGVKKKAFFLNNKLMHYFKKQKGLLHLNKRMDHVFTDAKEDPDMEQRYHKKLMLYYESSKQMNEEKQRINTEWERQRSVNGDLDAKVKSGWEELVNHKKEIAARLIDARTGRTVQQDKTLEDLLLRQENQWRQIAECKLAQIKLKRKIDAKKEERKMDHMGMDFNLMDYEKLSSLKEYYTDKITERNIEITEVNQKMAVMDDKLNNVREQLKHKEAEMEREQMRLERISCELNKKRANLTRVKATKHATERNTAKIKQQSGLLAYPTLLKDYEAKSQEIRELTLQTEQLRHNFREGVIRIRKLREIIKKRTKGNFSLASSSDCGTS
ncbi:Coiled-coil domain-containing protein 96 [Homalodisca vitripennis]|nr:Coiled-coil domain-containing protein 96 [Homalodisca vitripennis]